MNQKPGFRYWFCTFQAMNGVLKLTDGRVLRIQSPCLMGLSDGMVCPLMTPNNWGSMMIQWDFWVPFWDMVFYWDSHRGVTIAETKKNSKRLSWRSPMLQLNLRAPCGPSRHNHSWWIKNIPADGKPRERFDCLLPGESQSPIIYNIKCSSELFG